MSTIKNLTTENNRLFATLANGMVLDYSPKTDRRVVEAIDEKVFTRSERAAVELAREMQAWGCSEARQLGHAVVFWG